MSPKEENIEALPKDGETAVLNTKHIDKDDNISTIVERLIVGIFVFSLHFLKTLVKCLVRPARISHQVLREDNYKDEFSNPIVFLAFCIFLDNFILRTLVRYGGRNELLETLKFTTSLSTVELILSLLPRLVVLFVGFSLLSKLCSIFFKIKPQRTLRLLCYLLGTLFLLTSLLLILASNHHFSILGFSSDGYFESVGQFYIDLGPLLDQLLYFPNVMLGVALFYFLTATVGGITHWRSFKPGLLIKLPATLIALIFVLMMLQFTINTITYLKHIQKYGSQYLSFCISHAKYSVDSKNIIYLVVNNYDANTIYLAGIASLRFSLESITEEDDSESKAPGRVIPRRSIGLTSYAKVNDGKVIVLKPDETIGLTLIYDEDPKGDLYQIDFRDIRNQERHSFYECRIKNL